MDYSEAWGLEGNVMPPFADQREFHTPNSQPHSAFSSDGTFESSFSSSTASYEECHTPSRCDSFGTSDLAGFSSSNTSLGSNGSSSPARDSNFYPLTPMEYMVKNEIDEQSHLYINICHSNIQDNIMMDYNYSQANDMYGPLELHEGLSSLPEMVFDNLPGFLPHDTASSLPMTSSLDNFVVPTETFLSSEPYRPTTPVNMPKTVLGSPLEEYGQIEDTIKYFMSPRETHSPTPSPSRSTRSHSTLMRAPGSDASSRSRSTLLLTPDSSAASTCKSMRMGPPSSCASPRSGLAFVRPPPSQRSTALHPIRSTIKARVGKKGKNLPRIASNIDRVVAGVYHCTYERCTQPKGFERNEHLKRHLRIHEREERERLRQQKELERQQGIREKQDGTPEQEDYIQCPFCTGPKRHKFPLDRSDNFKSHVKRHLDEGKGSRTRYDPAALAYLETMMRKPEKDKNVGVPGEIYHANPRRSRASSVFKSKL